MDKNEKLKLGDIFLAPKEFFLNNSVGNVKQKIESYAEVRKDGRVMCAVVENIDSVFPHESEYTIAIKQKHFAPPIRVGVSKDYNFDCIELLSKEEMKLVGVLWFYFGA
jgi:hypothetical protein